MKKVISLLSVLSVIAIMSCKGPQGEVGPQGAQGQQGPQGAKGDAGTVNIYTSKWITVKGPDWFPYDQENKYYTIAFKEPLITQTAMNSGLIMCYFRYSDEKTVIYPLPTYLLSSKATIGFYPFIDDKEGPLMLFETEFEEPTMLKDYPTFSVDFRYVIIPNATLSSARMKTINWKNYDEVKKALELED